MYNVSVGDTICFSKGREDRPVAYTTLGKVILCRNYIPYGYAKIKSVDERDNCILVTAEHTVKDIYMGMTYEDFINVLPKFGYEIGFTRSVSVNDPYYGDIEEHQVYAFRLSDGVVIVGNSEGSNSDLETVEKMSDIVVYCPWVDGTEWYRTKFFNHGGSDMSVFQIYVFEKYSEPCCIDSFKYIDQIMTTKHNSSPCWPRESEPSLWRSGDPNEVKSVITPGSSICHILKAKKSLPLFENCLFMEKLKVLNNLRH